VEALGSGDSGGIGTVRFAVVEKGRGDESSGSRMEKTTRWRW
jgi:hypothetical protein